MEFGKISRPLLKSPGAAFMTKYLKECGYVAQIKVGIADVGMPI